MHMKFLMLPLTLSTPSFSPSLLPSPFTSADYRWLSTSSKKSKYTLPFIQNFCYPKFSYRNDILLTFPDSLWKGGKKKGHKLPPTENNESLKCHFQEEIITQESISMSWKQAWVWILLLSPPNRCSRMNFIAVTPRVLSHCSLRKYDRKMSHSWKSEVELGQL